MLWETYCLVHLSPVYYGRAVPLVWTVLEHPSSSVAYAEMKMPQPEPSQKRPACVYLRALSC